MIGIWFVLLCYWRSRDNDKYCIKCNVIALKLYLVECGRGGGGRCYDDLEQDNDKLEK